LNVVGSADILLFVLALVTPVLAAVTVGAGIVLARREVLSRGVGALLVGICVPILWPGLTMAELMRLIASEYGSALGLLVPDAVLLILVGGAAAGIYWLATRPIRAA
jgi:hypothetical protein